MSTRLLMEVGRRDVKIEIDGDGDRKLSVMDSGRLRPDLHLFCVGSFEMGNERSF